MKFFISIFFLALFVEEVSHAKLLYRGMVGKYPEEVAIYVADGFSGKADSVIVHLHGFLLNRPELGRMEKFDDVLREFQFDKLLNEASLLNSVLVVPSSRGKCETFKNVLSVKSEYESFLVKTIAVLIEKKIVIDASSVNFVLSSHSGSYSTIAQILGFSCKDVELCSQKKLLGVNLFDALYGKIDDFVTFRVNHPSVKFNTVGVWNTDPAMNGKMLFFKLRELKVLNGDFTSYNVNSDAPTSLKAIQSFAPISSKNPAIVTWNTAIENAHWKSVKVFFKNFMRSSISSSSP